jgi:hypothetical protein
VDLDGAVHRQEEHSGMPDLRHPVVLLDGEQPTRELDLDGHCATSGISIGRHATTV